MAVIFSNILRTVLITNNKLNAMFLKYEYPTNDNLIRKQQNYYHRYTILYVDCNERQKYDENPAYNLILHSLLVY